MITLFLLYLAGVSAVVTCLSLAARFFGRRCYELTDPATNLGIAVFWPVAIVAALIILLGWLATHVVNAIIGPRRKA